MANGDRMAVAKGVPNGELQKLPKAPKAGTLDLDRNRWGSADNTAKNYANDRKVVAGIKVK